MEVFDDLCDFCGLMLEIGRDDVLWMIVEKLDQIVKDSGVINLQRRVISIKIKGYRKNQDNAGYLQAAGLYYEAFRDHGAREQRYDRQHALCQKLSRTCK